MAHPRKWRKAVKRPDFYADKPKSVHIKSSFGR
jgi:hypothetical protein